MAEARNIWILCTVALFLFAISPAQTQAATEGESCFGDYQCVSGLYCDSGVCAQRGDCEVTCDTRTGLCESHFDTDTCAEPDLEATTSFSYCQADTQTNTCEVPPGQGCSCSRPGGFDADASLSECSQVTNMTSADEYWDSGATNNRCCTYGEVGQTNDNDMTCTSNGWQEGFFCLTEASYGVIVENQTGEYKVCQEDESGNPDFVPFNKNYHCSAQFIKDYYQVSGFNDIPAKACKGEVVYLGGYEYLAGEYSWMRSVGSCSVKAAGTSSYLDIKPIGCDDRDGDGYTSCGTPRDCSDTNPDINPGQEEICGDDIDNNCDGLTDSQDPDTCYSEEIEDQPACTSDADCGSWYCVDGACVDPGSCDATCGGGPSSENTCMNSFELYDSCNAGFDPSIYGGCDYDNYDRVCNGFRGECRCEPSESLDSEIINNPENIETSPQTNFEVHEMPTPSDETAPYSPMEVSLSSHEPGTCSCSDGYVEGTGSCNSGYEPACTDQNTCACQEVSSNTCADDSDCSGGQVCNQDTNTCVDPGSGESSDESAVPFDYPYWAECSANPQFNNVQPQTPGEPLHGGYNFFAPNVAFFNASKGERVCYASNSTFYCAYNPDTSAAVWTEDLDGNVIGCNAYGFEDTGNYCCGEADDGLESYSEPGQLNGACYNSRHQPEKTFLNDSGTISQSILIYEGQFMGCQLPDTSPYMTEQSVPNPGSGGSSQGQLVNNTQECTVLGNYYCHPDTGLWTDVSDTTEYNSCFERSRDGNEFGVCEKDSECYLAMGSGCVGSGNISQAKYCDNGEWTSRTRIAAEQLLGVADSLGGINNIDYALHCDDKRKSLLLNSETGVANTGSQDNACSLEIPGTGVALGVALKDGDSVNQFMAALSNAYAAAYSGTSGYQPLETDGLDCSGLQNYELCAETNRLWAYYDNNTHTMIISADQNMLDPSFFTATWNLIGDAVDYIFNTKDSSVDLIQEFRDFDKLYINQKGSRRIVAVSEDVYDFDTGETEEFVTVQYSGTITPEQIDEMVTSESTLIEDNKVVFTNPQEGSWELLSGRTRLN